jgi:transcriptional regulator with XRE-family HTH domain
MITNNGKLFCLVKENKMVEKSGEIFGAYLRQLRLQAGYGLRRFANLIEIKASNLCDIEHGRRSMPKEYLEPAAEVLRLESESADWVNFFELARRNDELPADLMKVAQRRFVPALLRTIDNAQLSDAEIKVLIENIQEGKSVKDDN